MTSFRSLICNVFIFIDLPTQLNLAKAATDFMLMGPATRKTSRMATVLGRHHVSKLYHMVSEDALTRSSMREALELGTATPLPGPKSKTCCRVTLVLTFCTTRLVTFMCAGAMHTRLSLAGTNVPSMNSEKS